MRAGALILVAALALVAAGCGGGGGSAVTPLELVANAAGKTTKADSAKFTMTLTETVGPVGPITINANGVSDNATHSARMSMDLSSIAKIVGSAAGDASNWKGDVILDGTNTSDVVAYMRLPAVSSFVPGAKPWLKLDLNALAKMKGVDFSQLLQAAGTQDPTQALQMIQSVGDVKKVGSEQVDGVDTTEYAGTLDPKKLSAKFGQGRFGQMLGQLGTAKIPVTVWVDGDGYVRKLEESISAKTAAGTMDVKLQAAFSDFGTTVDVTPPPADQTTDVAQLIGKK